MNLLIIGGTQFVGRALVVELLNRGHSVTLFHRGITGAELFPEVESILGDRDTDLEKLAGRKWDAVVDTCGYYPRQVDASCRALLGSVDRYLFISTISVYNDREKNSLSEDTGTLHPAMQDADDLTNDTYGPLKVRCEEVVREHFGDRATIVRPGLIIGPHDHTHRFVYWAVRAEEGGDILIPDTDEPITGIDVRDLASFQAHLLEQGTPGTFNSDNPGYNWTNLKEVIQDAVGQNGRLIAVPATFLEENDVRVWTGLPCWTNGTVGQVPVTKSIAAGLTHRSLAESFRDTQTWAADCGLKRPLKAGLTAEREQELLDKFQKF